MGKANGYFERERIHHNPEAMTPQEAKGLAAKEHGYISWKEALLMHVSHDEFDKIINDAIKLYARSKWDEACNEVCIINDVELGYKPEFKP